MNIIDFLKLIGEIRNNCGLDCFGPNYYVFIHKDLKRATVNSTGYVNMSDIAYVIVATGHRWQNLGYVNSGLTVLAMVDSEFNPVDKIPFGDWDMTIRFTQERGQWYNKYAPFAILELREDPKINSNKTDFPYEWDWHYGLFSIDNFTPLLTNVNEFIKAYEAGTLEPKKQS